LKRENINLFIKDGFLHPDIVLLLNGKTMEDPSSHSGCPLKTKGEVITL